MKKIILITLSLFTFINGYSQFIYEKYSVQMDIYGNYVPDIVIENLKGKVKKVTKLTYKAKELNGEPVKIGFMHPTEIGIIYNYDSNGNLIEKYKLTDSLDFTKQELREKHIFDYNSQNKPVKNLFEIARYSYQIGKSSVYEYDETGKVLKFESIKPNSEISYSCEYKYDKKSQQLISKKTKNSDGKSSYKMEYNKLDKGNLECITYDNGNADDIIIFDNAGRIVEFKGHRLRIISRSPMKTQSYYDTELFQYNMQGDIINSESIKGDLMSKKEPIYTYSYIYDKENNWIREITYKDDKVSYLVEREIEYYE